LSAHSGRPRLLIVGPLPPPIGGVETFTQAILESPALAAFEVSHCDTTKQRPKSTQGRFDAGNAAWALIHFSRLARALARFEPDVVYIPIAGTWSGFLRDAALGWLARQTRARVIGHQHAGDIPEVLARRGLDARLVDGGFAQFHRLLVLGERWRTMFVAHGMKMPIEICPSTFRREVFERGRETVRVPRAGTVRLLFVGQVGRRKGVLDLLDATARLLAQGLDVTVTIVGPDQQPGERDAAIQHAARRSLGALATFPGAVHGDALYALFREHDVFVLPSYNEGIPAVLYEAGAFGLPVVTTPVGAIPDLIGHERNGLLVAPGDVDALTVAIGRLAGDPALRTQLGEQLRHDVLAFHPDRAAERIADAVHHELGERDRAAGAST
jgi:glycosyltransferase involved in cell wall biosynthesis